MVDAVMLRGCSLRRFAGVFARVLLAVLEDRGGRAESGGFIVSERALLLVREGVGFWGGEEQHRGKLLCSACSVQYFTAVGYFGTFFTVAGCGRG